MVLYLLNSDIDPTAKITWLVIIMMLPAFGALLFWYTQSDPGNRLARKHLNNLFTLTQDTIPQDPLLVQYKIRVLHRLLSISDIPDVIRFLIKLK